MLRDPSDLLTNFLTETVNLLVNDLPQVRDVAREALRNEASHRLYGRIVKQLDECVLVPCVLHERAIDVFPQCHSDGH